MGSLPGPSPTTTAVVTGASSGIGADIARELASRGYGVTLVARREDRLRDLAEELYENDGVRVESIACDVADPEARAGLFEAVADRGLTVDILVNNADIGTIGPVAESAVADEIARPDRPTRSASVVAAIFGYCSDGARTASSTPLVVGRAVGLDPEPLVRGASRV